MKATMLQSSSATPAKLAAFERLAKLLQQDASVVRSLCSALGAPGITAQRAQGQLNHTAARLIALAHAVNAFTDKPADAFKANLHTAAATLTAVANDGVEAEKQLRAFTQHHSKASGHTLISATSSALASRDRTLAAFKARLEKAAGTIEACGRAAQQIATSMRSALSRHQNNQALASWRSKTFN
jgi:hypothetical protein